MPFSYSTVFCTLVYFNEKTVFHTCSVAPVELEGQGALEGFHVPLNRAGGPAPPHSPV